MNKEYLIDVLVIFGMAGFLILVYLMGWLHEYAHFAMVPFIAIYILGKTMGKKFPKKKE